MRRQTSARDRALRALSDLPPFSPVLDRVLASVARDDCPYSRLAGMIEKDTVLAGNLLKVVNSALFGRRGTVNSVGHAVSLLGIVRLRNAALAMSVARMWRAARAAPGWSPARFNLHSVGVAFVTDLVAQRAPVQYAEGAFAAGLFHDLGRLLIATGCRDEWVAIERAVEAGEDICEAERDALGVSHCELSAEAIRLWGLPDPIAVAARHHHCPGHDDTPVPPGRLRLSELVHAADRFANQRGIAIRCEAPSADARHAAKDAFSPLGLEDRASDIAEAFDREYGAISGFLS